MSGRYRAYPEYKDSGVEWLGAVPVQWKIAELKRYAFVKAGFAFSSESFVDDGEPVIRISDIKQDGSVSLAGCKGVPSDLANKYSEYSVSLGELVMAMTGATIGKAGWFNEVTPALVNQRVGVFKCNDGYLNYRFFWYLLSSYGYQEHIQLTAFGGAQPNISDTGMVGYKTTIPPTEEQEKIGNFLDHETAKIDTLIEKQQQLIKLLKEKRQAVISHAVTKGLNPNAPMRDSGVEWLGEVPEHWKVTKLGQVALMQEGPGLRTWQFKDHGTRVICVTNITGEGIDFSKLEKFISKEEYMESYQHFTVRTGDILLSSSGNSWGKVAKYEGDEKVILNTSTIRLNELQHGLLLLDYIQNFLLSEACREQLGVAMTGSCQPNFGPTHLKEVRTPIPPKKEQAAISEYISKRVHEYDQPLQACEHAIRLMQERRTALISAAVTGKIDVRGWRAADEAA